MVRNDGNPFCFTRPDGTTVASGHETQMVVALSEPARWLDGALLLDVDDF